MGIREPNAASDPFWQALSAYRVGPEDAALTFEARLARENGWSAADAERVYGEYLKFCYLAMTAGHEVTPSDAVDQAWHLHLTYTRDYWERFCPQVLGQVLHHGPTAGGQAEGARYFEQYARTLHSYEAAFGPPPQDVWPNAAQRFGHDPFALRVNPRDVVIVPRRTAAMAVAAFMLFWIVVVAAIRAWG